MFSSILQIRWKYDQWNLCPLQIRSLTDQFFAAIVNVFNPTIASNYNWGTCFLNYSRCCMRFSEFSIRIMQYLWSSPIKPADYNCPSWHNWHNTNLVTTAIIYFRANLPTVLSELKTILKYFCVSNWYNLPKIVERTAYTCNNMVGSFYIYHWNLQYLLIYVLVCIRGVERATKVYLPCVSIFVFVFPAFRCL